MKNEKEGEKNNILCLLYMEHFFIDRLCED